MNIGLAIESDKSVRHLTPIILSVNDAIEVYFMDRNYGSDLTNIAIGLILVTGSISERLHPLRPFSYSRLKRVKHPGTGQIMEIRNTAGWDVKPDFEKFKSMNKKDARNYLCEVLIDSTAVLAEHRNKFPDFDVERFRADFEGCLRAHCAGESYPVES